MTPVISQVDERVGFGLAHLVCSRNLETLQIVLCCFIEILQLPIDPCDAVQNFRWPVLIAVAPRHFKSPPKHGYCFRHVSHVSQAQPQEELRLNQQRAVPQVWSKVEGLRKD